MSTPQHILRSSTRTHTPRMSERKKSLFAPGEHRGGNSSLPSLQSESESDNEGRILGVAALDSSSSCDEREPSASRTPTHTWRETRSRTRSLLAKSQDMKQFIKSPYTLQNFQIHLQNAPKGKSFSTPATPQVRHNPETPSSSHSSASAGTVSSDHSRARRSLATLIADTESCSSSLKDLNFDTDSGTDTKENTPRRSMRKSTSRKTVTPKFSSFKGVLIEHKKNVFPMDCTTTEINVEAISPTDMLKTPHSTSEIASPPKLSHNRRVVVEIDESPDESERTNKRIWNDSIGSESGPNPKNPKLESAPKARLSLFSNKLEDIITKKSFYGKTNVEVAPTIATKFSEVITNFDNHQRRNYGHSHRRKHRKAGQINSGVRHRIRRPKLPKYGRIIKLNIPRPVGLKPLSSTNASVGLNASFNTSQHDTSEVLLYEREKGDPFAKEHQTIDTLLSHWTEEEVPTSEPKLNQSMEEARDKIRRAETLLCFNRSLIDQDNVLLDPNIPVEVSACDMSLSGDIMELGTKHSTTKEPQEYAANAKDVDSGSDIVMGEGTHEELNGRAPRSGQFLPVEGGYLLVQDELEDGDEQVTDLDAIERELAMLDDQLSNLAKQNNIDPQCILSTGDVVVHAATPEPTETADNIDTPRSSKLFPIFSKSTPVVTSPCTPKGNTKKGNKRSILKTGQDQYIIDAGQKKFGATQCTECDVIYQIGDPQDEHDHLVHHNAEDVLRFNGWKDEHVVGVWDDSRCVCVRGTAAEARWKKVTSLLERVVHPQLGYAGCLPHANQQYSYTAYLYIIKKKIVGCLIAEPKEKAHRLIRDGAIDCCSEKEYPVKCGVSRIWTHVSFRRRGVATRLLNCARASFLYGQVLGTRDIAFSAPTPAGREFAAKYTKFEDFYVYLV